jgi:hypothetical protein
LALISIPYAYVKALGGELEVRARLPGAKEVRITQFENLGELADITGRPRRAGRGGRGSGARSRTDPTRTAT